MKHQAPSAQGPWYRIQNAAKDDDGPAEVFIYDFIDSWMGVSAESFVKDLAAIDKDEVTVRINSPGGDVWDGLAIMNAIRNHKAKVTTVVDGIAASAASFIAMAGDEVVIRRNAEMMIHDASGLVLGNASDMHDMAKLLDRESDNIASIYADRTGGEVKDWRKAMRAETWYSDQEAVDAGLADRIEAPEPAESGSKNRFDLSIFNYAGRSRAPAPISPAAEAGVHRKEGIHMPTLQEGLAELLGIKPDSDEGTILAAAKEALEERATETPPAPKVEPAPAAALPDHVTVIDKATLDELRALAERGDAARKAQEADERVKAVENAIRAGRIAPSQRQAWTERIQADLAELAVLAQLAPVYPVGGEIGHGDNPQDSGADNYELLFGKEA